MILNITLANEFLAGREVSEARERAMCEIESSNCWERLKIFGCS